MSDREKGCLHPTPNERVRAMSDQEITTRYTEETLKLKTLNQFGRHSERFLGYPNTQMMNLCRRELERRHVPVPPLHPAGEQERKGNPA